MFRREHFRQTSGTIVHTSRRPVHKGTLFPKGTAMLKQYLIALRSLRYAVVALLAFSAALYD